MMSLLLKLNQQSLLQEIPCSSYLQVSSDGHVESSPCGMGQKQFPSHVSDEMKDPRLFRHLAVGRVGGLCPGMGCTNGCRTWLFPPHGLSCCNLCVHIARNRKDFPDQLFQTQFHVLGGPFSCSPRHSLWRVPRLPATRSRFPTGRHLRLPSCWRCGTS